MNTYIIIGLAVGLVFVLILIRFVYRKEKTPVQRKPPNPGFALNDPVINSKVRDYLAAEKKIEAIKYVRESTGIGLIEAKNFVEEFAFTGLTDDHSGSESPFSGRDLSSKKDSISDEITKLVAGGNKIQAIKLVVENFNIGLKEAKDFVEAIGENLKIKK